MIISRCFLNLAIKLFSDMLCQPGWLSLERQGPVCTWKTGRMVFICLLLGEGNDRGLQVLCPHSGLRNSDINPLEPSLCCLYDHEYVASVAILLRILPPPAGMELCLTSPCCEVHVCNCLVMPEKPPFTASIHSFRFLPSFCPSSLKDS